MAFKQSYITFIFLFFQLSAFGNWKPPQILVVEQNKFVEVSVNKNDSITIEAKGIASLRDLGNQLLIYGKKQGETLLRIGKKPYHLIVTDSIGHLSYLRLLTVIDNLPTLSLDYRDHFFRIHGRLNEASTWLTLAKLNLERFVLEANVTDKDLRLIEQRLNDHLDRSGFPRVKLTMEPFPTARLPKLAIANSQMVTLLHHYGLNIKVDEQRLLPKELIRVQVTLLEMRRSYSEKLGLDWPSQLTAQILPQKLIPDSPLGTLTFDWIAQKGHGKILAAPVLVTSSGSEADFFAGGEFPVKTKTKQTQTVQWKKYGISLKIKPKADPDGKLSIDLKSEISTIDPGEKVDGIPSLFTNSMNSHFDLEQAQSIALSGLIKKVGGETLKLWPGLGEIPIFGELFRSTEYQQDLTELLVLVTPSIMRGE
ncbi:MAG: hypothetical protein RJB66_2171 [Pseudomonadota bacterium]|jgi:pilus assembly protein CpaC